jgi:hypothetical protein
LAVEVPAAAGTFVLARRDAEHMDGLRVLESMHDCAPRRGVFVRGGENEESADFSFGVAERDVGNERVGTGAEST